MLTGATIIAIFCLYMGLLFALALWTSHHRKIGRGLVDNPLVYSLSLAVYCSSWTFFGSVGSAAHGGFLFLAIYLGPTLVYLFLPSLVGKMVRLKSSHHITSVADFISTRYEKRESLAAMVTTICLVGIVPYVSLQLKAVFASFAVITAQTHQASGWVGANVGPLVVALMITFTIAFGVRRLDPTERHEGMVMAVAAESLVKLVAFLAAGVFVVFFVFPNLGDLFRQLAEVQAAGKAPPPTRPALSTWFSYLVLSGVAVIFLPRQFHITVVENQRERHLRWAMWLLPLYLFLITLFVYPIAQAGLILGYPPAQADTFVLQLPLLNGNPALAVLVFIGGFSAATSMIMISSMTMSVMISNHLILPLVNWIPQLSFVERHLLGARWLSVGGFITLGYLFERFVGQRYHLADMGITSFAAILQLAPAILGGLFWRGGNRGGAMAGMVGGFLVWSYTLLLPILANSGLLPADFIDKGPAGWALFKPHAVLGLSGLDPVSHCVFWSMLVNVALYVTGSLWTRPDEQSLAQAESFVRVGGEEPLYRASSHREASISVIEKQARLEKLLVRYFGEPEASRVCDRALVIVGLAGMELASITELAEFFDQVERILAGSIGSATAHRVMLQAELLTPEESEELREAYAEILAESRARPQDLKRKIDYYREREVLIKRHAEELEEKVRQLVDQMERRQKAEAQLRESEERYRRAIEDSSDGVAVIKDGRMFFINRKLAEIFGYRYRRELVGESLLHLVHQDDQERVEQLNLSRLEHMPTPSRFDFKGVKQDGTPIYIAVSAAVHNYSGEVLDLMYLRDVTGRRRAEEDVRRLSQRLIEGIEEERRRLASDLHDEFGQALTALHLRVESLRDSLRESQGRQKLECERLIDAIGIIADNLRSISSELRPDVLDHLGLVPAVEWYLEEYRERMKGVKVSLQVWGFGKRKISQAVQIALYRVLQEALNNISKHAHANNVTVRLTYSHPKVIMVISDDGVGFVEEPEAVSADGVRAGIGLLSMKERIASVGGQIDVRSSLGAGVTIRVNVAVAPE